MVNSPIFPSNYLALDVQDENGRRRHFINGAIKRFSTDNIQVLKWQMRKKTLGHRWHLPTRRCPAPWLKRRLLRPVVKFSKIPAVDGWV